MTLSSRTLSVLLPLLIVPAVAAHAVAPITLSVDATDVHHRVLSAHEVIPVASGPQTLYYPEWLPGTHSTAFSSVKRLAGLHLSAAGQPLMWERDPVDMGAFHITVPSGITHIEADFQYLAPGTTKGDNSRRTMSEDIVALEWHAVVLYPAGMPVSAIPVSAQVRLPEGFKFATALSPVSQKDALVQFATTDLETLIDSPLLAGRYFRRELLSTQPANVALDIAADRAEDLQISDEVLGMHRRLVEQAQALFGSHHYDHYDFLLTVSDTIGGIGLEHHQSSEDGTRHDLFRQWSENLDDHDLLAHEYTHSWNGKFRRPADLTTPNYNVPMQDSLLWMYEGQTEYWGRVLATRSGLLTLAQAKDELADAAATYDGRSGRAWRNLQDTTSEEILAGHDSPDWPSWQRSADYYVEMQLVWLDADTKIRELTHEQRSLDDFARRFFKEGESGYAVQTYRFEDVVDALNETAPFDWRGFLRERLDGHDAKTLLDGVRRSGWTLVYDDKPNTIIDDEDKRDEQCNLLYSVGLLIAKDGKVKDVGWGSPAYLAGLAPGVSLVAVDGVAYTKERMTDALTAGKSSSAPVTIIVRDGDRFRVVALNYHDGLRYPHLVRGQGVDRLAAILSAKAPESTAAH